MSFRLNTSRVYGSALSGEDERLFGPESIEGIIKCVASLEFNHTPVHRMVSLAQALDIRDLFVKDEAFRSNLGSFKALGGGHAVLRLLLAEAERTLGRPVEMMELSGALLKPLLDATTVACATDGNHGRAVAAAAQFAGCKAIVFLHTGVSEGRAAALRELGAEVVRVEGSYDDSVAEVNRLAAKSGWHVISDTSWPGYERVPTWVMQGYLIIAEELIAQCQEYGTRPTHVFVQAGVGGLAAAIAAYMALSMKARAPRFIVVEPDRAACLFQSAIAQRRSRIAPGEHTVMAMLECYEPSAIAWRILEKLAYAFITVDDAAALRTMRRLACPKPPDPFILSGESGGAGVAGLIEAAGDARAREALGLDEDSVVLTINTEGATDRALYEKLIGSAGREMVCGPGSAG